MDDEDNSLSYHDVIVYVNGEAHRIANNYAYELSCTKAGGWQLWHKWGGKEAKLLGGEYDGGDFRIEIAGTVICGKKTDGVRDGLPADVGGWTGAVERTHDTLDIAQ